ncbi:NAD(P)-binding domain [Cordyceps militaris]|uniref:NAD(P)-binding domain n=1 Tax=Cordyceps militaris TaxID=73501 RepID=A0A2H4S6P5_CORMI|nr:NAD(P)-binding domain [Cordyceps militaris]
MEPLLEGYNALITGAGSGIGKATALHFAQHGAAGLALADIRPASVAAVAALLGETHAHVRVVPLVLDVTSADGVRAAVAQAVAALGRLDVAVNNAGVAGTTSRTHELPDEAWDRTLAVDLNGVFYCQREELAVMMQQDHLGPRRGRGVIINTASLYGLRAPVVPLYQSAYTAAKHAVVGLTKSDGVHYGPHGIRVNAVCPGYVETPLITGMANAAAVTALMLRNTPVERLVSPDEVADGIVFLASTMSSAMMASTLSLDLGISSSS